MRKIKIFMSAFVCCTLLTAVGCGNNQDKTADNNLTPQEDTSEAQTSQSKPKHNIVKTARADAELGEIAYTLEELIDTSDIIVKAKVVDTEPFVADDTLIIETYMTPEIIEVYKGEYNGSGALVAGGGYMKVKDYANAKEFQDPELPNPMEDISDEQLEEEVYFNWMNNYTPEVGDTIIFFGKEGQNGTYYEKNCYQGLFLCQNDTVENQALEINNGGFTEPLVEDLQQMFSNSEMYMKSDLTYQGKALTIPEDEFVNKLKGLH